MRDLTGKTAFITGGASGMGRNAGFATPSACFYININMLMC